MKSSLTAFSALLSSTAGTLCISLIIICLCLPPTLCKKSSRKDLDKEGSSSPIELQCPPCSEIFCTPRRANRLKCKGGITKGICNCCPMCAKVEGETCGGQYDYLGKCDRGLECTPDRDNSIGGKSQSSSSKWKLEGKCVKGENSTFYNDSHGVTFFALSKCWGYRGEATAGRDFHPVIIIGCLLNVLIQLVLKPNNFKIMLVTQSHNSVSLILTLHLLNFYRAIAEDQ